MQNTRINTVKTTAADSRFNLIESDTTILDRCQYPDIYRDLPWIVHMWFPRDRWHCIMCFEWLIDSFIHWFITCWLTDWWLMRVTHWCMYRPVSNTLYTALARICVDVYTITVLMTIPVELSMIITEHFVYRIHPFRDHRLRVIFCNYWHRCVKN